MILWFTLFLEAHISGSLGQDSKTTWIIFHWVNIIVNSNKILGSVGKKNKKIRGWERVLFGKVIESTFDDHMKKYECCP